MSGHEGDAKRAVEQLPPTDAIESLEQAHLAVPLVTDWDAITTLDAARADAADQRTAELATLAVAMHRRNAEGHRSVVRSLDECERRIADLGDEVVEEQLLAARLILEPGAGHESTLTAVTERLRRNNEPARKAVLLDLIVMAQLRRGQLAKATDSLRQIDAALPETPILQRWRILRATSALAFARGEVEPSRRLALDAVRLAASTRIDADSLDHFGLQLVALLRERVKLDDARPTVETWIDRYPDDHLFRATRAWVRAATGDPANARTDLEILFGTDFSDRLNRPNMVAAVTSGVLAALQLPDGLGRDFCIEGHRVLTPRAEEWIVAGDLTTIDGPVRRVLALASAAAGEHDRALAENDAARLAAQESGASLFIWHAIRDRGLMQREMGFEREAVGLLTDAAARYRAAGLERLADSLEASLRGASNTGEPIRGRFRRDKNVWHVAMGEETAVVRHVKGLPMIRALLGSPGQEVSARKLDAIAEGTLDHATSAIAEPSPQPIVDDEAVAAYRRRLDQLAVALDRADATGDVDASRRLGEEFDALTAELASTQGLGGRRRTMIDEGERARSRVTKSVRTAIRRVAEHAPTVAAHLDTSIKTGRYCIYQPDPRSPIDWRL